MRIMVISPHQEGRDSYSRIFEGERELEKNQLNKHFLFLLLDFKNYFSYKIVFLSLSFYKTF